jgi:hypothetical protein
MKLGLVGFRAESCVKFESGSRVLYNASIQYCCTGFNYHIWKYETFDHHMSPQDF